MKDLYTLLEQIFKCPIRFGNWISRSIKLEEEEEYEKLAHSESCR